MSHGHGHIANLMTQTHGKLLKIYTTRTFNTRVGHVFNATLLHHTSVHAT